MSQRSNLRHYAQEYGQGKMTLPKAAEQAGVSVWDMMEYLREKKISAQYSLEDLEHDLKDIYRKTEHNPA